MWLTNYSTYVEAGQPGHVAPVPGADEPDRACALSAAFVGRPAWAAAEGWRLTSSSFPPAPRDICGGLASCYGANNESHGGDCHLCFPQESRGLHLGDEAVRPFLPLAERYPALGEHHHLSGPSAVPQRSLKARAPGARVPPAPKRPRCLR